MRRAELLNENWLFQMEGSEAEIVSIPHCYNSIDGQDGSKMFRGIGVYKNIWALDAAEVNKKHYLEIGAAELTSKVKINGILCAEKKVGFSLYRVAIDPYLQPGENTIEVIVSNEINNRIYPGMADFSFYGGLYRDVRVITDDDIHFAELDGSRDGITLFPEISEQNCGVLRAEARIDVEEGASLAGAICKMVIKDADDAVIAEVAEAAADKTELTAEIADAHRWHGVEDPYLYSAEFTLTAADGAVLDQRSFPIGFRTFRYDKEKGFMLNEKPYKLHGVAKHQDFGGVGNAIRDEHRKKDMELILEMGANTIRCSHYQHCDEWYEMCDRAGLLVWAEVPVISAVPQKAEADENAKEQLTLLIAQARNHTSIYCWGVQNEVCMITKNSYTFRLVDELAKMVNEMDPSRMTAQANERSTENNCPIFKSTDILGFNYYYGWYYGTIPELQGRLDAVHAENPDQPMMLTEYGVDTNPRFHSLTPKSNDYTEEYQLMFLDNAIQAIEERTFMIGGYAWNMFDFGSAGRDEGGKGGQNQKGLVTIDRALRKDAYYLFKAYWSKVPFVYLAGRRFVNRPQEAAEITVLSNCQTLELTVNGVKAGEKNAIPMTKFENVALNPGENIISVIAKAADGSICTDEIVICRVEEPDPSYVCPVKNEGSNAVDWFMGLDPETMERVEEKPLRPEGFTLNDIIPDIFDNLKAREIFCKYLSPITDGARFNPGMPINVHTLLGFMRGTVIPDAILKACEQELNTIDK